MTSFWTNTDGLISGPWGSLDYWSGQQNEHRGDQPWFYYYMVMAMYEFLPLVVGLGAVWWAVVRGDDLRFLDLCAKLELDGVDFNLASLRSLERSHLRKVKKACLEHGHGKDGVPGQCLVDDGELCAKCVAHGRSKNLTAI